MRFQCKHKGFTIKTKKNSKNDRNIVSRIKIKVYIQIYLWFDKKKE